MAELKLERVDKLFGDQVAVSELSLDIPSGAFAALLGPSGCGKTTTLRILAGLESLSRGRLLMDGRILADASHHLPPEQRQMGMVFQSYALWPHMTVAENVGYPLKLQNVGSAELRARVMRALEMVELGSFADRQPQALSGGQRQRVALARCLISEPKVVLLDEPLANLDRHLRATMEETFREFHRRTGATFVYVTHDQAEAMSLASHVAVMHRGRLMQWGTPEALYRHPANAWVAGFVGRGSILTVSMSAASSRVDGDTLHAALARRSTPDVPRSILVRPENVQVADDGLPVQVTRCIYQGERYLLQFKLEDGQLLSGYHAEALADQQRVHLRVREGWLLEAD